MAKCSLCGNEAVATIRYARLKLCKDHFISFIQRKVKRTIDRYGLIERGHRVVLAVSSGKDSVCMADILVKLSKELAYEVVAIHLDLGIEGYSSKLRAAFVELCTRLNVVGFIIDVVELLGGMNVADLAKKLRRPICSVCGIVKRYLLNAVAEALNASSIATGHNADDMVCYIIKSFLNQDYAYMSKLTPKTCPVPGAVPRIRPLYEVYERETLIYCILRQIPYVHTPCPYAPRRSLDVELKRALSLLEEHSPGLKISFLRRFVRNASKYKQESAVYVQRCSYCGSISSSSKCAFCKITEKALGKPMGMEVKKKIEALIQNRDRR